MTTEIPEAPARPDPERAAPAEPVARGVIRIGRAGEPPARGRASVRGAINPAHRHAPPYLHPARRDRTPTPRVDAGPPNVGRAEAGADSGRTATKSPADSSRPIDVGLSIFGPRPAELWPTQPRAAETAANSAPPQPAWPPTVETAHAHVRRGKSAWPPSAEPAVAKPAWPPIPARHAPDEKPQIGADQSAEPSAPNPEVREESKKRRRGRGVLVPLAAGVLAAFVAGTGYLAVKDRPITDDIGRWTGTPPAAAPNTAASDTAPFAVPADGSTADPFGLGAQTVTGVPTRLKVKAIGIDTSLETLRLGGDGELTPPENFGKAGFYADGTLPGDVGPAVIAGHVDSKRGPAVFYKLREMQAGDKIQVVRGGRTLSFTVTSVAWYPKNKFPTDEVYGPTPDRQLRLITCGGVFDHSLRSYKDNLVVYAVAG
ncbi:sortase [Actinoplanes sp. NPDC051633]|uniref:sortase domain-containing protein n=1 Tax=Actinoplanes sp. NPDC051633 TaxID=3155670 RepID=UPI0034201A5C